MEQFDPALSDFLRAYGMDQTRAETLYLLGTTYQSLRQYENAVGFYEKAYEKESTFKPEIRRALLALYLQTGERYKWDSLIKEKENLNN